MSRLRRLSLFAVFCFAALPVVAFAGLLIAPGCANLVPLDDAPPGEMALPLEGRYALTMHTADTGSLTGTIAAEPVDAGFRANTRPNAAQELLGGFEGLFAPVFGGKGLRGGAIGHWESPLPSDGESARGVFRSAVGSWYAIVRSADEPVKLETSNARVVGFLTLTAGEAERDDYDKVVESIRSQLQSNLYDPSLAKSEAVKNVLDNLNRVAGVARNDLEFAFGAFAAMRDLPFSHAGITRDLNPAFADRLRSGNETTSHITLNIENGVARLKASGFSQSTDEIDAAFEKIARQEPRALLVGLRS